MAVEYLQGELQRVSKTLDLQESLVNGCDQEFLDAGYGKEPASFHKQVLHKLPNLILYLFRRGRRTSSPPQFGQIFFIAPAHFSQKLHS